MNFLIQCNNHKINQSTKSCAPSLFQKGLFLVSNSSYPLATHPECLYPFPTESPNHYHPNTLPQNKEIQDDDIKPGPSAVCGSFTHQAIGFQICVRTLQHNTVFKGSSHLVFLVTVSDYKCGSRSPELNGIGFQNGSF